MIDVLQIVYMTGFTISAAALIWCSLEAIRLRSKVADLERQLRLKETPKERKIVEAMKPLVNQHGTRGGIKEYLLWHPGANPHIVEAAAKEAERQCQQN